MSEIASGGAVPARLLSALAAVFILTGQARADERVEDLTTELRIDAAGTAAVHHHIVVTAEGDEIKRGIYFEIPRSIGPAGELAVTRNGAEEPFHWDDGELRIGDEDVFLERGRYEYDIRYRAGTPFRETGEGAIRLTWKPLVLQFELPWSQSRVDISWPADRTPSDVSAPGASVADGRVSWAANGDSKPGTIAIEWNAGSFPAASVRARPYNPYLRYGAIFAALFSLLYFHTQWRAHGRDLPAGPTPPRSEPPRGISAGACRFVKRMSYDPACLAAALTSLAVKGAVSIMLEKKARLRVSSRPSGDADLSPGERALKSALFAKEDPAILTPSGGVLTKSFKVHRKALRAEFGERYFKDNQDIWLRGLIGSLAAAAVIAVFAIIEATAFDSDAIAIGLGLGALLILIFAPLVYYALMRAPTVAGRALMDEIDSLEQHLKASAPLAASGDEFVRLLPYAVALDAEKDWAARFGDDLPAAEDRGAQAVIEWYAQMRRLADDATLVAVIIPAVTASSGSGAATAGGASAGGW